MKSRLLASAALILLAACSQAERSEAVTSYSVAEAPAEAGADAGKAADTAQASATGEIPVNLPKIAYIYAYGFRVAASDMPALQRRHADLCEKQGPKQCRIIAMEQNGGEGDYATGSLHLEVAAPRARAFGAQLAKAAEDAGGTPVSSSISGEDLSKEIVDTEARLRARILLRDRLMEVLASRKGTVAELVEAERGVAQVNEEIDQAQSWLAEMKGRVEFSKIHIDYRSGSPSRGGFIAPIRDAIGSIGSILGQAIGFLIIALTALLPFAILIYLAVALRRRKGWTWPRKSKAAPFGNAGGGDPPREPE